MVQNKRAEQDKRAQKREAMLSLMLKRRIGIQHTTRFWKLVHYESLNTKYRNAFSAMIHPKCPIPQDIMDLTGITQQMADKGHRTKKSTGGIFGTFLGQSVVIGHNLSFDLAFLKKQVWIPISIPVNSCFDTLSLARRKVQGIADYRLETLAGYFEIKPNVSIGRWKIATPPFKSTKTK